MKIFYLMFFLHFWRAKLTYVEFLLKWAKKNYWNKTRLSQNCRWWILLVRVLRLEDCVLDFSDASRVENSIFEESRLSTTFVSLCNHKLCRLKIGNFLTPLPPWEVWNAMQSLKKTKDAKIRLFKGRCNNFTISRCFQWFCLILDTYSYFVKSQDDKRVKIIAIKSPNFTLLKGRARRTTKICFTRIDRYIKRSFLM